MISVRRNWWRSAGVRFGFAYTILFGFSAIAVVACVWALTAGESDRRATQAIQDDWHIFRQAYVAAGRSGVTFAIDGFIHSDKEQEKVYRLADSRGETLGGNIDGWFGGPPDDGGTWEVQLKVWGAPIQVRLQQFELPEGLQLLIGRNVQQQAMLWNDLWDAVPWTAGIVALLAVFGAATTRRLFASMLEDVSATAARISAGDLSSRVPVTGRADELDELADTINEMLDRIGRLMDGVREVSNSIAHDLRTPIARARARLEDAARAGGTETELRAGVDRAIADLDGVVGIFHALLRIAEIEAGARRSAFASYDLAPLLRDLVELYEPAAEEGGQTLALGVPEGLPTFGDRDMLQQAVANLLDNALKFSPPGGMVRVEARQPAGRPLTLSVSDQGPGIPPEDRARATERFFRGETARNAPGSGLGLALVQAVAVLHGGALRLEDNAPGLRAVITMPGAGKPVVERAARETLAVAKPHEVDAGVNV